MSDRRLRVGVPAGLLALSPTSGHGKVWSRVLEHLSGLADVRPLRRRLGRAPDVALASGHDDVPATRAPLVVEIHESGWSDPQLRALLDPDFLREIESFTEAAVRAAARVITLSEAARRDIVAAYDLDPAHVHAVHLGVDPVFRPDAAGGAGLVARSLGGREAPYVLYAAMIHPRKNLAAVREAMARLAAEGLPHALAVAGGPATDRSDVEDLERDAAAELPGAPGRVARFHSPTDSELAALMAGASAFCMPSLHEGFGLTVAEAMACATPVVVSDRGSLPEVVADAGLVAAPDPDAVTDALRTLLTNAERAAALGRAAAVRARSFTWERTAQGWLDVLAEVAGDARASGSRG